MSDELTKREILVLAAACRRWPKDRANWWYLGEDPLRVGWSDDFGAIFWARGAKDG